MAKLMAMLSKMDKKDLEAGIAKANEILNKAKSNENCQQGRGILAIFNPIS